MNRWFQKLAGPARSAMISLAMLAMWTTTGAYPVLARQTAQQTFASAAQAGQSLFQAVQQNNAQQIANILGGRTELASSGDTAQDKLERELFIQKYQEMHRVGREADGTTALYIGAENWPFPLPLVERNGVWRFDPDAGQKEILFRRIGENELTAIATCHDFVAAEKQQRAQANPTNPADNFPASLLPRAGSESADAAPVLFQGYYFRVVAMRPANRVHAATEGPTINNFALIAYPAEYRSSGVMTFIVTGSDVVYEKDLGSNSSSLASAITTFHKDATWQAADE